MDQQEFSLEQQLRQMLLNQNPLLHQHQQHQSHPHHHQQQHDPRAHHLPPAQSQGHSQRAPPAFAMAPPTSAQSSYSNNIPMDRQQDFTQFLQKHGAMAPAPPLPPHRRYPAQQHSQQHGNNLRNQGPHRAQTQRSIDPDTFSRPQQPPRPHQSQYHQHQGQYQNQHQNQRPYQQRQLYQPRPQYQSHNQYLERQASFLDSFAAQEISKTQMLDSEIELKDAFRLKLQSIFEHLKSPDPENPLPSVELASFGSLSSGFATAGSDMDLAIVTSSDHDMSQHFSSHENGLPRVLEKKLLDHGIGARLLTRTRVPIIKICEQPPAELLDALRESREKWDNLSNDEKYATSKPPTDDVANKKDASDAQQSDTPMESLTSGTDSAAQDGTAVNGAEDISALVKSTQALQINQDSSATTDEMKSQADTSQPPQDKQAYRQQNNKNWRREKAVGPLDFPKDGVGIQCDINFFNPLGIHNTQMLRCYSKCDPRVRPMVLFIKSWAKRRKINSSYSGTLSSYGYVLMVLHYLVNVTSPPVLPNLQHQAETNDWPSHTIDGHEVRFYDQESVIERRAQEGLMTDNNESLGKLLVGFFRYYAVNTGGFFWTRDVLSLRTSGGLVSKQEKGWTGAKTEVGENKEVRHRYLFAIEDPFETTHNVARTVTHNGIVAIRDEFRRAWRIINAIGRDREEPEGGLFDELIEPEGQSLPHTTTKMQAYGQQFPTLAGSPSASSAPQKVSSPARAPVQPERAVQPPSPMPKQEGPRVQASQPETAPLAVSRGKGRRQKFVPLNL